MKNKTFYPRILKYIALEDLKVRLSYEVTRKVPGSDKETYTYFEDDVYTFDDQTEACSFYEKAGKTVAAANALIADNIERSAQNSTKPPEKVTERRL